MNEELEKNFLKEINTLINEYELYANQEIPYSSGIKQDTVYTSDEVGDILKSIDEEIEKIIASQMEGLKEAIEKEVQEKRKEIYSKAQEFINKSKEEIDKEIEEKNKQIKEKEEEIKEDKKALDKEQEEIDIIKKDISTYQKIDQQIYNIMNTKQKERMEKLKKLHIKHNKKHKECNNMKKELVQLEEKRDNFDKTYSEIDFTSKNGINDLKNIIKLDEMKEHFTKIEEEFKDILPQMYLDYKKGCIEDKKYDVELPSDLKSWCEEIIDIYEMKEKTNPHSDEERKAYEELKEKLELIKERENTKGQQQPANPQPQTGKGQQQPANPQPQTGNGQQQPANPQPQTGKGQQQPANSQPQTGNGQQQPANSQPQTGNGQQQPSNQSLAYMKEIEEKLNEMYEEAEKGYKDLLPKVYDDVKEKTIKDTIKYCLNKSNRDKFLKNYEEYKAAGIENVLDICREIANDKYTKLNGEVATDEEKKEIQRAIETIEKRKGEIEKATNPHPKEGNGNPEPYKETKIVEELYNDRIMIYIKGRTEPIEYPNLAQLMEDGETLYKSSRYIDGLTKGITNDYAILAVLSKIKDEKNLDYIKGYSYMFSKNSKVDSPIDKIVYDCSQKGDKIPNKDIIKKVEKSAKRAEKNGVAESIERKKGIIENGKGLFEKGITKVLALGEGIGNFHPIEDAIKNKKAKKYSKDFEVDGSKATGTYNKWLDEQNKAYEDSEFKKRLTSHLTQEEQKKFIEDLMEQPVFKDRSEEENEQKPNKESTWSKIINMSR